MISTEQLENMLQQVNGFKAVLEAALNGDEPQPPQEVTKDDFWWKEAEQAAKVGVDFMLTTAVSKVRPDVWEAAMKGFTKNGRPLFDSNLAVVDGLLAKCTNPNKVLFFRTYLEEMNGGFNLLRHGTALAKANNTR